MLKTCPDPVDVQDIQFKLHCSLKIFDNNELATFSNNHSLVSAASRYGLLFVGSNSTFLRVIQLKTVENYHPKDKEISNFPRRNVPLPSVPKHVCVNCDGTLLAIVVEKDNCPTVIFYDVLSFYKQNINVINEVRLSASPGTYVTEVNWNPALPNIFTACKSDRSLGTYELKGNSVDINELPQAAESTSFCWSPKGKQIAVGSKNGNITQYKPDLKAVKVINGPTFETPHSLISLCWVSNYQFIGIYQAVEDGQAKLVVVDAPKTGETSYTNYDDVCYSGASRTPQFYLILLQHWNMLMIASSNSMELGLLGGASEIWTQWNVPDFARAELPLSADKQDTLPIGMGLDTSSTKPLPWGEGTIPPCPYLLLLSHQGVLFFFNIVNLRQGMPSICCPPDSVNDMTGLGQFIVETKEAVTKSTPPQQQQQQQPQSTFSFATPQSTIQTNEPTLIQQPPQPTQPFQTQSAFSFAKPISTQQPLPSFGVAPSSAPPASSLFGKPIDSKPLFGPQVTITPVVKPQPQSQTPTEISSSASLFGNASLNLIPVSKPTNISTGGSSEKYSSIYAALKAPSALPAPTPDMKPIIISTKPEAPFNKPTTEAVAIPETPKSAISETPRSNIDVKVAVEEKERAETDALLAKMVREECLALESELKALLHQGRRINTDIGSDEEKIKMVKDLNNLRDFIKEIVDVSLGERAEIHSLKQNLILSWAWFEEALSRYNMSKDETMTLLLKSQPLDCAAEKRHADIRKIIYYLESQLYQASRALDEQWDQFQDYAKRTYKVEMPTMETIFQSMVLENALLSKQSYIIDYLGSRLKQKNTSSTNPSLFLSLNNSDKLEESLSRLQLDPDDGHRVFYEQALERNKTLSFSKRNKLRNLLKSHEVSHVTAAKPQLNASISLIKSPIAKNKHLVSILGAHMSPVPKPAFAKHLQFSESTPMKFVQDFKPTTVPPNTPALPDPSRTFTFKGIEKSNIVAPPISIPVPKNAALLSQNQSSNSSAFVPTTPTSKTFLIPQVQAPSTTLSFNFSSKQEPAASTNTSQLNFGSAITITPVAKRPETASGVSNAKSSFSFAPATNPPVKTDTGSTAPAIVTPVASKPIFAGGSLPPFGDDAAQSLFSFGKTPSVPAAVKSTPFNANSTAQNTFSFGKTTASISPADSTVKTSSTKTASVTPISTKPVSFVTPTFSETLPKTAVTITSTTTASKSISFGSTTTSTTTKSLDFASTASTVSKVTSPVSTNSFSFSFGAGSTTTNSLFSGAATTTTTSLFGSITTPSVVSSIFGAKPIISADSTTQFSLNNTKSISSSVAVSSTVKSTAPTSIPATKSIFTTVVTSASPLVSSDASSTGTSITPSTVSSDTPAVSTAPVSSTPSIFASNAAPISSSASIFASGTPPVSDIPSIFGSPPVSSTKPLFATSLPSTTTSIFSSAATVTTSSTKSIFDASTATAPSAFSSSSNTSSDSIFAAAAAAPSSPGSIFAGTSTVNTTGIGSSLSPVSSNTTEGNKSSIFGQPTFGSDPTSTSSIFASSTATTQPAIFSSPALTTQTSIFSNSVATTQSSIFGTPTTSTQSVFGSNAPAAAGSVFGTPATTSIFGSSTASTPPVFGSTTTATEAPIFGTNTTSAASVFGGTSTTQSSIFGAPPSSTGSIFGGTPTTQTSIFGAASPTTTQGSAFGSPPSLTSSNSVFGGANTTSAFGSGFSQAGSIFGAKTTTSSFGGPSTFGTPQTTAFSQSAPFGTNTGSIFGTPTTSSSVFGSGGGTFGAVSSSGNVFGSSGGSSSFSFASAANSAGSLGFGDLNVGNTSPVSGGSIFGGSPTFGQTPPNPFGRAAEQKSVFGDGSNAFGTPSTTGSIFGSSTGNSGSIFGGNTQNTFGSSSFGSPSGFGQQQATFGQSGGFGGNTSFGNNQPGPFSGGGVGVGQTGFGSPGSFQKQSGAFGAAPVFGGSPQPSFGTSPGGFGATPAFGGAAAFGSPSKVFGGTPPASSFGQSTGSASPGFGNLATQNTVGFGSLAQQAATPTSQFSGGSSFSSWR